jgi:hypothetical protein
MNTPNNLSLASSYYNAMLAKDFDKMAGYLHDNVHFIGPLAEMHGKEQIGYSRKKLWWHIAGYTDQVTFCSR